MTPRGIRNRNPGNIRISPQPWQGKIKGPDTAFETFDTMDNGVRAIYKILIHYIKKDSLDTIWEIISKWAPPSENSVTSYVNRVCKMTHMAATQPVQPTYELLRPIVHAICVVENGGEYIEPEVFARAWKAL